MNVRAKNEKRMELTEFQFTKKRESQKKTTKSNPTQNNKHTACSLQKSNLIRRRRKNCVPYVNATCFLLLHIFNGKIQLLNWYY